MLPGFLLALGVVVWVVGVARRPRRLPLWAPFEALIPAGTALRLRLALRRRRRAASSPPRCGWRRRSPSSSSTGRPPAVQPVVARQRPRRRHAALLQVGAVLGSSPSALSLLVGPQPARRTTPPPSSVRDASTRGNVPPDRQPPRRDPGPAARAVRHRAVQRDVERSGPTGASPRSTSSTATCGRRGVPSAGRRRARGSVRGARGLAPRSPRRFEITGPVDDLGPGGLRGPGRSRSATPTCAGSRSPRRSSSSTDHPTSDGLDYEVTSAVPDLRGRRPRAPPTGHIPDDVRDAQPRPARRSSRRRVTDEARRVVAGRRRRRTTRPAPCRTTSATATSPTRSTAPSGHSDTAIESFLFDTRTGYCEQFAGTYAAMARAVGLPARVAVGFTPGEPDPLAPGALHRAGRARPRLARGVHRRRRLGRLRAHARTRGAPGAEAYTGRARGAGHRRARRPSRSVSRNPGPQFPTEHGAGGRARARSTTTLPLDPARRRERRRRRAGRRGRRRPGSSCGTWAGSSSACSALAVARLLAVAVRGRRRAGAARRLRRRIRATISRGQGQGGVGRGRRAVEVLGRDAPPAETPLEFARRLGAAIDGDGRPRPLAAGVEQADFAPTGVTDDEAAEAAELSHGSRPRCAHQTTARQRLLAAADPRPPERRRPPPTGRGPRGPRIQIRAEA